MDDVNFLLTTLASHPWITIFLGGLFGLMCGSFFNVVIWRMPRGESVVWPPSRCPQCQTQIKFYQNVPVLSWLWLKGKCKNCGVKISAEYPIVEAITGIAAALTVAAALWLFPSQPLEFKLGLLFLVLSSIPIFVIDFRHYLIPDVITFPGIIFGIAISFLPYGLTPLESFSGGLSAGLFLWLIGFTASFILKKEAMGFGDVKLIAMGGALFGLQTALFGLLLASLLGSVIGLPMMLFKRLNEQRHIPFGPYICLGLLLSALFGDSLLEWYMHWLR